MANKGLLFDEWLEDHLANETDEYNEDYEKELFKLKLALQMKKIAQNNS